MKIIIVAWKISQMFYSFSRLTQKGELVLSKHHKDYCWNTPRAYDRILALLKALCSPLKKILAVNTHLVERDCNFAMFWPPDLESVPNMPA